MKSLYMKTPELCELFGIEDANIIYKARGIISRHEDRYGCYKNLGRHNVTNVLAAWDAIVNGDKIEAGEEVEKFNPEGIWEVIRYAYN